MNADLLWWAEWVGAAFGIIGALAIALHVSWSKWGFVLFLISNLLIGVYAVVVEAHGVLAMQVVYGLINVFGLYRWLKF
jgi:nicotinamide riboside transporter PnuC